MITSTVKMRALPKYLPRSTAECGESKKLSIQRQREVEQLKTLVTAIDATREELVSKLKASMAYSKGADQKIVAAQENERRSQEEAQNALADLARLRFVRATS